MLTHRASHESKGRSSCSFVEILKFFYYYYFSLYVLVIEIDFELFHVEFVDVGQ